MRILLTGGGSGGHIFPLVAVARRIKELASSRNIEVEMVFVGPDKFSKEAFRGDGIEARVILAVKLRRYFSPEIILDFFKLPISLLQAYIHVFSFMPDIIFAKGGYGSAPVVLVGWIFRIPIIVHESDTIPGISNKLIARFAKKILVSFDLTAKFFDPQKTIVTGNPIREELFLDIPANPEAIMQTHSEKPIVFVIGGSQGAQEINNLLLLALPDIVKKYEIIHQCGQNHIETMRKGAIVQLKNPKDRILYHVYPLLSEEQMSSAYYLASVVVSRAGSGAIFEIAASGKPSVLLPYLSAAGDHQLKNAEVYEQAGACLILRGKNLLPHILIEVIDSIVEDPARYKKMSAATFAFIKPNSAQRIAEEILHMDSM